MGKSQRWGQIGIHDAAATGGASEMVMAAERLASLSLPLNLS